LPTLSKIFVYPIKSCAGIELSSAEVTKRGFILDRRWMLVDAKGRFLTQRKYAQLSQINVTLLDAGLKVSGPEQSSLFVPFESEGKNIESSIWSDQVLAREVSGDAHEWFSDLLGEPVRLVYMPDETTRMVDQEFARPNDTVGFADGYPFLIVSQSSVDDLASKMNIKIDVRRFRPNLVVEGTTAFDEDSWNEFEINGIRFHAVKRCARCVIPTIDPITSEKNPQINKVLSSYRQENQEVYFGQNLIHDGLGSLSVGMEIKVLS